MALLCSTGGDGNLVHALARAAAPRVRLAAWRRVRCPFLTSLSPPSGPARRGRRPDRPAGVDHAGDPAARRRSPTPCRSRCARSAATTTAARPGTGTTSPPASTPAPTSTRRCTGSPGGTAWTSPRSRRASLIAPAVVLDFSAQAAADPDFLLEVEHIKQWEARARPAARAGLAAVPHRLGRPLGQPAGVPERQRDRPAHAGRLGGVRALAGAGGAGDGHRASRRWAPTPVTAHSFDPPFPCHSALLGAGKYGLTQLQNLAALPATGAVVIAGPLPIVGGSGSPARVLALVERASAHPDAGQRGRRRGPDRPGRDTVFGLVGSGNFHVTNALISRGARFVAARHENGAASMADGWARLSGPARRGLAAPGAGADQRADGASPRRPRAGRRWWCWPPTRVGAPAPTSASTWPRSPRRSGPRRPGCTRPASRSTTRSGRTGTAAGERRCVILALPLDVQAGECTWPDVGPAGRRPARPRRPRGRRTARPRRWPALLAAGRAAGVHRRPRRAGRPAAGRRRAAAAGRRVRRAAGHLGRGQGAVPRAARGTWTSAAASPPRWRPS